ncbi:MAG: hypothetical protein RLZZ630_27, partial [Bacteroidota bacterium]
MLIPANNKGGYSNTGGIKQQAPRGGAGLEASRLMSDLIEEFAVDRLLLVLKQDEVDATGQALSHLQPV